MKKLSITFGNGIFFYCFPTDKEVVHVSTFEQAWWSRELGDITKTVNQIKQRLPNAQLEVVSHEPIVFLTGAPEESEPNEKTGED